LLREADKTLNSKLVDMSQQVLLRQRARIATADALQESIDSLRQRMGSAPTRAILGQDSERTPGGVALRVRTSTDDAPRPAMAPGDIPPPGDEALPDEGPDAATENDPAAFLRLRPQA
jgi:hypothetical protein